MKKITKPTLFLILILVVTFFLRIIRIDYPQSYVFDEVYYPFTAKEYLKGNSDAWVWWTQPPPGNAYQWVNPPFPQEIMAITMSLLSSQGSRAYRLPGVLFGVLSVFLVFKITELLFKNSSTSLLAAFLFSIDGLNFVQSRTGMIDIYLTSFILLSLFFLLKKDHLLAATFLGLALGGKWTALYMIPLYGILLLKTHQIKHVATYAIILPITYLLIYLPFFISGYNLNQFIELFRQQWSYHTTLKATHDYASPWWSWPLNLYPVWYFVEYHQNNFISNIFAAGNTLLFWGGSVAIIASIIDFVKTRSQQLLVVILAFLILWLPWSASPRLMFLYYFSPAVPFLCIALAYQLNKMYTKNRLLVKSLVIFITLNFLIFYPILVGIPLPKNIMLYFFGTNLAKNPFGG